jgi:hypothetical protein
MNICESARSCVWMCVCVCVCVCALALGIFQGSLLCICIDLVARCRQYEHRAVDGAVRAWGSWRSGSGEYHIALYPRISPVKLIGDTTEAPSYRPYSKRRKRSTVAPEKTTAVTWASGSLTFRPHGTRSTLPRTGTCASALLVPQRTRRSRTTFC